MRPEWLQKIFDEEREEGIEQGRKSLFNELLRDGVLTKEQVEQYSKKNVPVS